MKIKLADLEQKIIPAANEKLDLTNEQTKGAITKLMNQVNEEVSKSDVPVLSAKLAEAEEALKEIELRRAVRQLRATIAQKEIEVTPVIVGVKVPAELRDVLRQVGGMRKK